MGSTFTGYNRLVSRWGFSIEPADAGTRVTQTTEDLRTEETKQGSLAFLPEVPDRRERNLETMAATLNALARACEQPSIGHPLL